MGLSLSLFLFPASLFFSSSPSHFPHIANTLSFSCGCHSWPRWYGKMVNWRWFESIPSWKCNFKCYLIARNLNNSRKWRRKVQRHFDYQQLIISFFYPRYCGLFRILAWDRHKSGIRWYAVFDVVFEGISPISPHPDWQTNLAKTMINSNPASKNNNNNNKNDNNNRNNNNNVK